MRPCESVALVLLSRRPPVAAALPAGLSQHSPSPQAMVNFGSSWCSHCHAMLPPFLSLAKAHPGIQFALAQVDYMQASAVTVGRGRRASMCCRPPLQMAHCYRPQLLLFTTEVPSPLQNINSITHTPTFALYRKGSKVRTVSRWWQRACRPSSKAPFRPPS